MPNQFTGREPQKPLSQWTQRERRRQATYKIRQALAIMICAEEDIAAGQDENAIHRVLQSAAYLERASQILMAMGHADVFAFLRSEGGDS